ncbi:MAG: ATP-binding protein [Alkalilacustris sp.]
MQGTPAPHPADAMAAWALGCLARADATPPPAPPPHDRLDRLVEAFGLDAGGRAMVALFYGLWLTGGAGALPVGAATARRALGDPAPHLRSLLVHWSVLCEAQAHPGGPLALVLDETIADWLEGGDPIPPAWRDRVTGCPAPAPMPSWPVADLAARATAALHRADRPFVLRITGPEGSGRRSLAACVAAHLGTEPIVADLRGLEPGAARALMQLVDRAARLSLRPPAWLGGGRVGGAALAVPAGHAGFALSFDITGPDDPGIAPEGATMHRVRLGSLSLADRAEAWARLLPGFTDWPAADRDRLVRLKPARLAEVVRIAAARPPDASAALALLRADQAAQLPPAVTARSGRLGWDDLILPDRLIAALRRLTDEIALGPALWQDPAMDRLFPHGRGVFALFAGPSGTGKTMAAQVVAHALGLDLHVVDGGAVVSKYVGETSQNLQAVFARAEADAAVLFFDEADGLFGKRTETRDAHARYLNADTNVLLQAVEQHPGPCILATNRRDNLDGAFLRRLRHAIDFPRPDGALRARIWSALVAELSPDTAPALAPHCGRLAATLDFTGAQIKNALRSAVIEARRQGRTGLVAADLSAGIEGELLKEGRALTAAEAARLGLGPERGQGGGTRAAQRGAAHG